MYITCQMLLSLSMKIDKTVTREQVVRGMQGVLQCKWGAQSAKIYIEFWEKIIPGKEDSAKTVMWQYAWCILRTTRRQCGLGQMAQLDENRPVH